MVPFWQPFNLCDGDEFLPAQFRASQRQWWLVQPSSYSFRPRHAHVPQDCRVPCRNCTGSLPPVKSIMSLFARSLLILVCAVLVGRVTGCSWALLLLFVRCWAGTLIFVLSFDRNALKSAKLVLIISLQRLIIETRIIDLIVSVDQCTHFLI